MMQIGERDLVVFQPVALAPEHQADVSRRAATFSAAMPRGAAGIDHGLGLIVRARRRGEHVGEIADRRLDRVVDLRAVEDAVRPRGHHVRRARPASLRAARPGAAPTGRNSPSRAPPRRYCRRAAARPGSRTVPAAPPISWSCRFRRRACRAPFRRSPTSSIAAWRPVARQSEPPRRRRMSVVIAAEVVVRMAETSSQARLSPPGGQCYRRRAGTGPGAPRAQPALPRARSRPTALDKGLLQWRKSRLPIRSSRWTATR